MKGATHRRPAARQPAANFNPRSREGSDRLGKAWPLKLGISIHAPVKGATISSLRARLSARISIHAPVKGATGVIINIVTNV